MPVTQNRTHQSPEIKKVIYKWRSNDWNVWLAICRYNNRQLNNVKISLQSFFAVVVVVVVAFVWQDSEGVQSQYIR